MTSSATGCEGQLSKFTNVVKGWQYRWFVLDARRGQLEYYLSREQRLEHRCRGSQELVNADVIPSEEDEHTFVVHFTNGQSYRLKAKHARDRHVWVDAIRAAVDDQSHDPRKTTSRSSGSGNNAKKVLMSAEEAVLRSESGVDTLAKSIEESKQALNEQLLLIKATSQATLFGLQEALQILIRLDEREWTPVRRGRQTESPLSTSSLQQRKSFSTRSMWSALSGSPKRSKKYNSNSNNALNNKLSTSTGSLPAETKLAVGANLL